MVSRVALVGASNLVSFERQWWETYTCLEPCRNRRNCPQFPYQIVYKNFAASGARFQHPDPAKNLLNIFYDPLSFRPHTEGVYHDCIMNSSTLPPHATPMRLLSPRMKLSMKYKFYKSSVDPRNLLLL